MTKFDQALDHAIQTIGNWEYKKTISKIYLYGSCARMEQRSDSDIDLYIELESEIPLSAIRELKVECNPEDWRLPEVDIKVDFGESTVEKDDLFHRNIKREGILLWEKR